MIKKAIKDLLPRRLLPRLLLIFLVPLIIIQCSVIFFFYDRHWEKIINRFSNIAANNINLLADFYAKNSLKDTINIAQSLNIKVSLRKSVNENFKTKSRLENKVYQTIKNRVNENIKIDFQENFVSFFLPVNDNYLKIDFPKKYLLSETPTIYILWIIFTSLVLSLIAFLFLRIQIRAIYRLAQSAENFGRGNKIKSFKPEGAMEIKAAGNAFIKMQRRINNYIEQKTSFLTGISHDLGTIITRIKLRLELLDNKSDTTQIKKDVETMQLFLKEYLEYSRKNNNSKFETVNLLELISEVVQSSKSKNKEIKIKCSKSLRINTDKNSLFRIMFNLFENASRYGSKIHINANKKSQKVIISIDDNGPGIDEKFIKHIFKPFYKIDNSRNLNKSGSGLGLSIAKDLAKKINAKINCKNSKILNGCLFTIEFPIKK